MRQIAERADVSIGTVSHVVNGTSRVRPKLRERVLEAIRSLGFQPSALAQGLRTNRTRMLGMIIPDISNPFFPSVVRGAEDVAFKHSYRVVLCNTDNDPAKESLYFTELRSYRTAGLLIIPAAGSDIASALKPGTPGIPPVVCLDRRPEGWTGDSVVVANELGAYGATQYLIEAGHRNLAVITGPTKLENSVERLKGFRKALKDKNLTLPAEFVQEAAFDTRSGFQAAKRLLKMLPLPTAIFACNDLMALGALHAIHEMNLRCPEDISLIGFDNLEFCEYTNPPLTSVYQPGYQLGAAAANLLLDRVNGMHDRAKRILLETELKIRSSVLPLGNVRALSTSRKASIQARANKKLVTAG